jgi:hypothetical protein
VIPNHEPDSVFVWFMIRDHVSLEAAFGGTPNGLSLRDLRALCELRA